MKYDDENQAVSTVNEICKFHVRLVNKLCKFPGNLKRREEICYIQFSDVVPCAMI